MIKKFISTQQPGFISFIARLIVFAILFIGVTGILGPWIIATKLLYGFHFFIYPNMGKMILFSSIAFIILSRHHIRDIKKINYNRRNILFLLVAVVLIPVFFNFGSQLLKEKTFSSNLPLSLFTHALAVSIPLFLVLGVFGWNFITYFVKKFKKEIFICFVLSIFFYFAIFQVWKLWPYLSGAVLKSVAFLLSLHISPVYEVAPLTLFVEDFAVRIEQACSGLDSIFLFTSLYVLIALVDWKEFNKKKLVAMYFFALIGVFAVNIVRVYLLILVGVYIDPKLALQLFHTYIGMVLFMIYFFLFWLKAYKWMKA